MEVFIDKDGEHLSDYSYHKLDNLLQRCNKEKEILERRKQELIKRKGEIESTTIFREYQTLTTELNEKENHINEINRDSGKIKMEFNLRNDFGNLEEYHRIIIIDRFYHFKRFDYLKLRDIIEKCMISETRETGGRYFGNRYAIAFLETPDEKIINGFKERNIHYDSEKKLFQSNTPVGMI